MMVAVMLCWLLALWVGGAGAAASGGGGHVVVVYESFPFTPDGTLRQVDYAQQAVKQVRDLLLPLLSLLLLLLPIRSMTVIQPTPTTFTIVVMIIISTT